MNPVEHAPGPHGLRDGINRYAVIAVFLLAVVCAGYAAVAPAQRVADPAPLYSSPSGLALSPDGTTLYVAEAGPHRIAVIDCTAGAVRATIPLPDEPSGCALSPDGAALYVTCGVSNGIVAVVDTRTRQVTATIPVGHSPCSPVLTPDGRSLFVCNRFNTNLMVIDTNEQDVTDIIPMLREPIAAAITPDGETFLVANHLPTSEIIGEYGTDGGYMSLEGYPRDARYTNFSFVLLGDTKTHLLTAAVMFPPGSTTLEGIAVSPDGRYAYVTHILARYHMPTTTLDRGAMNTNALTVIDVPARKRLATVLLDDIDHGAANPWDVACTPDGRRIIVTQAGTHEMSIIDRAALHDRIVRAQNGEQVTEATTSPDDIENDLGFLTGIRRRVRLAGNGPRSLAVNDSRAYTAEYFSGTIGVVDLADDGTAGVSSLTLGPQAAPTTARLGERFFHDADICYQNWQSCASCHPDGRSDALTWDLLNDGFGNPKKTRSLLDSSLTPPVMVTGVRASSDVAVRAGIRYILFTTQPESVAVAIDAYLTSLTPVPSPYLIGGNLSPTARQGERIFQEAGCAECHPAPLFTDLNSYDAGTGIGRERDMLFDTPHLVELWRTAPYLYDGRALDLYEVIRKYNMSDRHGKTSRLSYEDINALSAYLLAH